MSDINGAFFCHVRPLPCHVQAFFCHVRACPGHLFLDSRAKHGNDRGEEKNTGMTGKNKSTGMTEEELSLLSAASFMSSSASSLSYSGLTRISKK